MSWYDKTKHAVRYWLLRRLPACKQTVELISQSMERPLTLRERVLLKLHLWVCMWCQWYLEHLQLMRDTMRVQKNENDDAEVSPTTRLSDEARERIRHSLTNNS
jgi:putative zinc finger protein